MRWPFPQPTLRSDRESSPGVFPTATSRAEASERPAGGVESVGSVEERKPREAGGRVLLFAQGGNPHRDVSRFCSRWKEQSAPRYGSAPIPIASGLVDGATCFVRQGRAEMGRTGRTGTAARVKQEQRGGRANGSAASRVRAREAVGVRHAWWMTQPHGAAARPCLTSERAVEVALPATPSPAPVAMSARGV